MLRNGRHGEERRQMRRKPGVPGQRRLPGLPALPQGQQRVQERGMQPLPVGTSTAQRRRPVAARGDAPVGQPAAPHLRAGVAAAAAAGWRGPAAERSQGRPRRHLLAGRREAAAHGRGREDNRAGQELDRLCAW